MRKGGGDSEGNGARKSLQSNVRLKAHGRGRQRGRIPHFGSAALQQCSDL